MSEIKNGVTVKLIITWRQINIIETATDAYSLINITAGLTVAGKKGDWKICLTANNITNTVYADHLSRLKYYGLYNEGVNFVLSVRKELRW